METHAHHLHKAPGHGWQHYFFEFLMLFLAVFCGFVAENIRENKADRGKEKDYVRSLIEDLKSDTAQMHANTIELQDVIIGMDTLLNETYQFIGGHGDTRKMYYHYHNSVRNAISFTLSQQTLDQLINSGSLRLIKNENMLHNLTPLILFLQANKQNDEYLIKIRDDASLFGEKIFDFKAYQNACTDSTGKVNIKAELGFYALKEQPDLITKDSLILKEFCAKVGFYRNSTRGHINNYITGVLPHIEKLIQDLKKEYKL